MKKLLLGAAAALAIAAPGMASAQESSGTGYIDLSFGQIDADVGGDTDVASIGGAAEFGDLFQIDGRFSTLDDDVDAVQIGGHLFKRNETWLIGGFAGYTNIDNSSADADEFAYGVEGQYYLSRSTIGAAISRSESEDFLDLAVTSIDLDYRLFLQDNTSIVLGGGWGTGDAGPVDVDVSHLGIGAEHQLASVPLSLFAGYRSTTIEPDGGADVDSDTWTAGIRWNFGGETLFERNRSGAALNGAGVLARSTGPAIF